MVLFSKRSSLSSSAEAPSERLGFSRSGTSCNPKVFFKYFYVNTATGEKSGEMHALARFAATNEQPAPKNQNPGGQSEGGNQGGAGGDENPEQGLGF